ncbi:MAG: hypothetical protein QG635_171, partial [Bacteroidota bacterium]|nr:hypothetical protein [Bacteroidota bacterium]
SQLVNNYGEECLKNAVVPVILDGENCWEFYFQNGIEFRRELFHQLSDSTDFQTVTCSEACTRDNLNFVEPIKHICAGSWIYGNFKIWIGHREDLTAWTLLANARKAVEDAKSNLTDIVYSEAMEEVYIAEGSDWFWWYGDEHQAPNKSDFDVLFRWHLQKVYSLIGIMPPPEIQVPISEQSIRLSLVQQAGQVNPVIDGRSADKLEWEKAGYYDATLAMSAMHQVGEFLNRFWFASDGNLLFFRIDTTRKLSTNDIIEIKFLAPVKFSFIIRQYSYEIKADKPFIFKDFAAASDEITEFSFSKSIFFKDNDSQKLELSIRTVSENGEIIYPRQGNINLNFVF